MVAQPRGALSLSLECCRRWPCWRSGVTHSSDFGVAPLARMAQRRCDLPSHVLPRWLAHTQCQLAPSQHDARSSASRPRCWHGFHSLVLLSLVRTASGVARSCTPCRFVAGQHGDRCRTLFSQAVAAVQDGAAPRRSSCRALPSLSAAARRFLPLRAAAAVQDRSAARRVVAAPLLARMAQQRGAVFIPVPPSPLAGVAQPRGALTFRAAVVGQDGAACGAMCSPLPCRLRWPGWRSSAPGITAAGQRGAVARCSPLV